MKRIHLLPNVITAFGLSCGLFAIFKMNMTGLGQVNVEVLTATAGILLLAALADLLDGAVARVINAESEFGGLFDSLADAITFGVGPSVIVLKSLSVEPGTPFSFVITAAAMVYSVCGVLRLVRFNVLASQAKGNQKIADDNQKNFTGMPIPAGAAAIVSANLFLISDELRYFIHVSHTFQAWLMCMALIFIGYLMICRLKFPSIKRLHVRVKSFRIVFFTVLSAVLIFYGLLHHFSVVFFVLSWLYLVISLVLSCIRLISGSKSQTLADFEPEPDELDDDPAN